MVLLLLAETISSSGPGPKLRRSLLAVGMALCLVTFAQADWPHLRGPNYDGLAAETGLADSWPAEGPPRLWSRELNQGYSGFVVAEGKVYTQRQTLGGQYLLCLDPDSGQTIWETRYDWAWHPRGAYPGPYASPTWYRGKVYWTSPTGLVGCVDAQTGKALWSLNLRERFQGQGFGFGYAATPLVEDDRVILPVGGPDASLVALHADDGRVIWTTGSDPASYCPALPISFQGRRYIVGYLQNALVLIDCATGKLRHRQMLSSGYDEHSAWPLYQEPYLLLASPFRLPAVCLKLEDGPDDALLCRPHWTSRELCNDIVSSVLYQGHIFGFDLKQLQASKHRPSRGIFKCLEWSTGRLCWSTDRIGQATVLVADGKLLLVNDTGALIMARAAPAAYQELARTQLFDEEICWTPPTLWQGKLFVRSPAQAICVYVGRPENAPKLQATSSPTPSARSWRLNTFWLPSRERDFPNDAPSWEEMTLWFGACLLPVFGGAALAAGIVALLARRYLGRHLAWSLLFWGMAFILGFVGSNLFGTLWDSFLFTWPASLYAAFHLTLLACWWAEHHSSPTRARWWARLAILGFLLVGYGYFELCQTIGMFIAWSFLIGFLPGFPLTLLAVRAERKLQPCWVIALWTLLAFTVFFWSCQGLLLWKTGQGT